MIQRNVFQVKKTTNVNEAVQLYNQSFEHIDIREFVSELQAYPEGLVLVVRKSRNPAFSRPFCNAMSAICSSF